MQLQRAHSLCIFLRRGSGLPGRRSAGRTHARSPEEASAVIIGEPTSMQVVNAHKSAVRYCTEVTGHEAHSALTDRGVNAIMVAGEIISRDQPHPRGSDRAVIRRGALTRLTPPFTLVSSQAVRPTTSCRDLAASPGRRGFCPMPTGNMVPRRIAALARKLEPAMKAIAPNTGIATIKGTDVPGLAPRTDSPAEALGAALRPRQLHPHCLLLHRSRAFPADRHSIGDLRSGFDRTGPQAG